MKPILVYFLMLFLLASCTRSSGIAIDNRPFSWVESPMLRVGQNDAPGTNSAIHLFAARGEYEAFQIIVRPSNNQLTNVSVAVSALSSASRHVIDAKNIQLYREQYVYANQSGPDLGGSNPSLGAGWYPDALIPVVDPVTGAPPKAAELIAMPFDLASATNQPIWADIFVPYGTLPGLYEGRFTITSDQGSSQGTIQLTVWNFELPRRPSLQSSIGVWNEAQGQATAQELIKHKLMPRDIEFTIPANIADRVERTSANLRSWSGANANNCIMSPPPSIATLLKSAASYPSDLLLYNYTADEIDACPHLYDQMKLWAQNLHQARILNLVTMAPIPALYDDGLGTRRSVVDIWVMLPLMYDKAQNNIEEVRRKGDATWSYNALVQDDYSPKWQIDFAPMNFRIQPGFISQSLGLTGILYWRADLWTDDPWNDVRTYNNGTEWFYGDGMLLYPGQQVGFTSNIASMRLKWLREGVEDYEYVEILKKRGYGDQALAISRQVAADWHTWTRDPQAIEQARQQLADLIVKTELGKSYLPLSINNKDIH